MAKRVTHIKDLPGSLKSRFVLAVVFYASALLLCWILLRQQFPEIPLSNWLLTGIVIQLYQLTEIGRFLHLNRREEHSPLLDTMGSGTTLTLFRGVLVSLIGGFIFMPAVIPDSLKWIIAITYTLAAISDRFDGYLARVNNHTTKFGQEIDMRFDALGIFVATLLAWQYGQVSLWYILIGLSYYIFVLYSWFLQTLGVQLQPLSESKHRRLLAGMQMGFLAVCLWPVFTPPATTLTSLIFGIPLILTFIRDGLTLSGAIKHGEGLYHQLYEIGDYLFFQILLPGSRLFLFGFALFILSANTSSYTIFSQSLSEYLKPALHIHPDLIGVSLIISIGAVVSGLLARTAALYLLLLTGAVLSAGLAGTFPVAALFISAAIVVYGAGAFTIWNPEDAILQRRDGEE